MLSLGHVTLLQRAHIIITAPSRIGADDETAAAVGARLEVRMWPALSGGFDLELRVADLLCLVIARCLCTYTCRRWRLRMRQACATAALLCRSGTWVHPPSSTTPRWVLRQGFRQW